MAVNTAARRISAVSPGIVFLRPLPYPYGAVRRQDRAHLGGAYAGLFEPSAGVSSWTGTFEANYAVTTTIEANYAASATLEHA